jgi:hypothetical protein
VTGNSSETSDLPSDGPGVLYLDVTAASGTTPTLDIDLEVKDPLSGQWFTLVSLTQATGVTTQRLATGLADLADVVFRAVWTIGGTTPDFTFSLCFVVKDRG